MRSNQKLKSLAVILLLTINSALVYAGTEISGGGDLCEDRIKVVRDDLNIWIVSHGSDWLTLPAGTSIDQYSKAMLHEIANAKIKCVGQGDQGYPIEINGTPKVCRFDKDIQGSRITCDFLKFNATSESGQYVLIHHEYAGLGNIEQPLGDDSDYSVSNQISGYLEYQLVKKLVVKPPFTDIIKNSDGTFRYMVQSSEYMKSIGEPLPNGELGALEYCESIGMHLPSAREQAKMSQILCTLGISETHKTGYDEISAINADGKSDTFYFSNFCYEPTGDQGKHWYWLSSLNQNESNWAYYFNGQYGELDDLHRSRRGAVRCVAGHKAW